MFEELMQPKPDRLKPLRHRQQRLLEQLIEEPDIHKAAVMEHIGRSTLRWLKEPAFQEALYQKRSEIHRDTILEMHCYTRKALHVLKELLESPNEQVRLKAGNALIAHSLRREIAAMK